MGHQGNSRNVHSRRKTEHGNKKRGAQISKAMRKVEKPLPWSEVLAWLGRARIGPATKKKKQNEGSERRGEGRGVDGGSKISDRGRPRQRESSQVTEQKKARPTLSTVVEGQALPAWFRRQASCSPTPFRSIAHPREREKLLQKNLSEVLQGSIRSWMAALGKARHGRGQDILRKGSKRNMDPVRIRPRSWHVRGRERKLGKAGGGF